MTDPASSLMEQAEELWESLGGELCICQRPDIPHWCEGCQQRIGKIADVLRSAHEEIARLTSERDQLKSRALYANCHRAGDHSTACFIWGDDGGADGTKPHGNCNCRALELWERERAEKAESEVVRLRQALETSEALRVAAREYVAYLNDSDKPLADPAFKLLKGRVITLACNLAASALPPVEGA